MSASSSDSPVGPGPPTSGGSTRTRTGRFLRRQRTGPAPARRGRSHFTSIIDLAFDPRNGTLYVYEIARKGWLAFEEGFAHRRHVPQGGPARGTDRPPAARARQGQAVPAGRHRRDARDGTIFVTDGMFTGGRFAANSPIGQAAPRDRANRQAERSRDLPPAATRSAETPPFTGVTYHGRNIGRGIERVSAVGDR